MLDRESNGSASFVPFSEREKVFFARQIQQLNTVQLAFQNTVALVIEQHGLEGQWRVKADGSGLEKVEAS